MPVWHEKTRQWVADGRLSIVGIVQEQHAGRARLYCQWRQFDWPVVQDSLNLLQVEVVPIAVAIDENGIVCSHQATPGFLASWLDMPPATATAPTVTERDSGDTGNPELQRARRLVLAQPPNEAAGIDDAIDLYQQLLAGPHAENAATHFEAAVARRVRYDITGNVGDFQLAIDHWSRALELDPNHYIYRRRIQQYGARLGKPYPFYDWIGQARADIRQRGEEPVPLRVPLSGAEIAQPVRQFTRDQPTRIHPDPDGQIQRDIANLIDARLVAVPARVRPGEATRVHLILRPSGNARWNNEAGPTVVWLDSAAGVPLSANHFELPRPDESESAETRTIEFELGMPEGSDQPVRVSGFALLHVCRSADGVCLYLRRDFEVEIRPRP